jgi:hypothetical protein
MVRWTVAIPQDLGPFFGFVPRTQKTPTLGDKARALDGVISYCDQLLLDPNKIMEHGTLPNGIDREFPVSLLYGLSRMVKDILYDVARDGKSALRRFERMDFSKPKAKFQTIKVPMKERQGPIERRALTDEGAKEYAALIRTVKADLLRVRAKLLGIKPVRSPQTKPSPIGAPRKRHIDEALRMLREGVRKHKQEHPDSRECWEWVFQNIVVPHFEKEVWPTMIDNWTGSDEQIKYQKKNLRNALRARGAIGAPPPKKITRKIN